MCICLNSEREEYFRSYKNQYFEFDFLESQRFTHPLISVYITLTRERIDIWLIP